MSQFEQEHLLIDVIQHYPFIYDKSVKEYKDVDKKNLAWETISSSMGISVDEASKMWKNLRDRYSKERKAVLNIPSGAAAPPPESVWPLYKHMSFMQKYMLTRRRTSNVSRPSSAMSSVSGLSSPSPLMSPTEGQSSTSVWDSYGEILSTPATPLPETHETEETESEEDALPPAKQPKLASADRPLNVLHSEPSTSGIQPKRKKKARDTTNPQVENTLAMLQNYLGQKQQPDKNMAFGQYIGLTLSEMSPAEQNFKKLKIVEILNKPFTE